MTTTETVHASCVAIDGRAVLIEGPSGSGKSDLTLRLIDRGWTLVADDRTIVERIGDRLFTRAPDRIAGRIEVRGVGIVSMPFVAGLPVALVVTADSAPPRMPRPETTTFCGVALTMARLTLIEASTPCKIELLIKRPLS